MALQPSPATVSASRALRKRCDGLVVRPGPGRQKNRSPRRWRRGERWELRRPVVTLNRPGIVGGSNAWEIGAMNKPKTYSPEVRERAVRMGFEHAPEYPS
jgi:hypothetical protein